MSIRKLVPLCLVINHGLFLGGCTGSGESESLPKKIDDSCADASECSASSADCVDIGDGTKRCEARCLGDNDCGPGAHCLYDPNGQTGFCYRMCDSSSDCVSPEWRCMQVASDTTQMFCTPPCFLYDCSASSFSYTCDSPSYTYDMTIRSGTTTTDYTFGNGHQVHCSTVDGHGACSDDTGSECTY